MSRLLLAELNRLRSRRLTWVALGLVALALALMQLAVFYSVRPLSAAELAQGQAQYQQAQKEYEQNRAEIEEGEKQCVAEGNPVDMCHYEPRPEDFSPRLVVAFDEITGIAVTVAVFLVTLAFLFLGASFIGAEFSSGALANWLSFIPERGKVFASKLLAVVLAAAVVSAVSTAVTIGVAALLSRSLDAPVAGVGKLFEMSGRGVVIGVIGAVLGFTLAMLTRHTIAAAGIVLGYLFVSFVLSILTSSIEFLQGIKRWLPENNVLAFLNHGHTYEVYTTTITSQGSQQDYAERTISFAASAGYWSVIVVVLVGATFLLFRRRDVN